MRNETQTEGGSEMNREEAANLVKPLIDAGRIEDAIRIYEEAIAEDK